MCYSLSPSATKGVLTKARQALCNRKSGRGSITAKKSWEKRNTAARDEAAPPTQQGELRRFTVGKFKRQSKARGYKSQKACRELITVSNQWHRGHALCKGALVNGCSRYGLKVSPFNKNGSYLLGYLCLVYHVILDR